MRRKKTKERRAALLVSMALAVSAGACTTGQKIIGVVPVDWPAGIVMPIEAPLPGAPGGAPSGGHRLNNVLIQVKVGSGPATLQTADIGLVDPSSPGKGAILRTCLSLKESDRGQRIELVIPHRPPGRTVSTCSSQYREPFLQVNTETHKPVLSYWHGPADSRNSKKYPLNDFIHPLIGLDGEVLTAASPGDHVHHRGIFWAWVRTERQGKWRNEWWIPRDFVVEPGRLEHDDAGATSCRFVAEHF